MEESQQTNADASFDANAGQDSWDLLFVKSCCRPVQD